MTEFPDTEETESLGVDKIFKTIAITINNVASTLVTLTNNLSAPSPPKAASKPALPASPDPIPPVLLDCINIIPTSNQVRQEEWDLDWLVMLA
jgi:hypothetical protein